MRRVAVLGLGRFGMRLARELAQHKGVEVIAIDRDDKQVEMLKTELESVVCFDITEEQLLIEHGIGDVDVCVVAVGENFETTMFATLNVKKMGISRIIARAQTDQQAEILRRIGENQIEIVLPETEAARHWTRKLIHQQMEDFFELDDSHGVMELRAPKEFQGQSLRSLDLRRQYSVNLIALKRGVNGNEGEPGTTQFIGVPSGDEVIQSNDILVLLGAHDALADLPQE